MLVAPIFGMDRPPVATTSVEVLNSAVPVSTMNPLELRYLTDWGVHEDGDAGIAALLFQHCCDLPGGTIAEELAQCFLVVRGCGASLRVR